MPTNSDAIADLETAKAALEDQVGAATGSDLDDLLQSIQKIADEVGALEVQTLADSYVPQTTAFQRITGDAKAFIATLNKLKAVFAGVAAFAAAADKVISYVK